MRQVNGQAHTKATTRCHGVKAPHVHHARHAPPASMMPATNANSTTQAAQVKQYRQTTASTSPPQDRHAHKQLIPTTYKRCVCGVTTSRPQQNEPRAKPTDADQDADQAAADHDHTPQTMHKYAPSMHAQWWQHRRSRP
jgi:hypothetical protein